MARAIRQALDGAAWSVRAVGDAPDVPAKARRRVAAVVPGCVHLDLMRAGVIGDPAIGFNELDQFWVGKTDWEYRTTFRADERLFGRERIELVCEGLDTIASVVVNGERIGDAANMFHPHRFDVSGVLKKKGVNELVVRFRSPLGHVRAEEARIGARPVNGDWDPYIFIRKAACNFGWDWGPKVPTVGIWKPIRLEGWSGARIVSVRPLVTRAEKEGAEVEVCVEVEGSDGWSLEEGKSLALDVVIEEKSTRRVVGKTTWSLDGHPVAGRVAADETRQVGGGTKTLTCSKAAGQWHDDGDSNAARLVTNGVVTITRPKLWWPLGHGGQPLYRVLVALRGAERANGGRGRGVVDRASRTIGLRTVRLNTGRDEHGSKFQIEVNGKPIFCKGANWIPDDLFPTRITATRLRRRVKQAAEANMNMLRVWGGGYYEDDAFYDACDRMGVMVWQDFMFSCAMYPEESPYPELIEAEARHQAARLSSHPSVVLWCGGNECVWGWQKWGWKERLKPGQTWGARYYFEVLPRVVREVCPTTPYWANSPLSRLPEGHDTSATPRARTDARAATASSFEMGELHDVLDPDHGDRHTWDAQFEEYRKTTPRFLSEFGRQAPADLRTLRAAMEEKELAINSKGMQHRQRATGGNAVIYDAALERFGLTPGSFREWHRVTQGLQAKAVEIACEWAVKNQPRCMGVLIWQLNDCWPALSWSLIDSAGRKKPAYEAVKRVFGKRGT